MVLNPMLNLRTHLKLRVSLNKHHLTCFTTRKALHAKLSATSTEHCAHSWSSNQHKFSVPCYLHIQFALAVVTIARMDEGYRCIPSILKN